MNKLFTLSIFLFIFQFSHAQMPFGGGGFGGKKSIKGKITGELIDSISGEKIGFATLSLKRAGRDKVKDGILSELDGNFRFAEVKTGKYDIYISFLGYKEKVIKDVELTLKKPDKDLGTINLLADNVLLEGVEITEKRALIENKVDRLVYNVEDDASIAGGDATDALRKVPLLSVDQDGNVALRGSQNVKILINGKPSGMFSNNVADALKMFPADQIKKVEVITAPSAKYDGEGSAGIINIVTKKENIDGVAGTINASLGNRQNNLTTNLNAGKGRFGFSSSAAVFYMVPTDGTSDFRRVTFDGGDTTSTYIQEGVTKTSRLGGNANASIFYDFNAFNAINSSFNFRGFGFGLDGTNSSVITDRLMNTSLAFDRSSNGDNFFGGFDWNTDYTKTWEDQKDRELVMAVQYSKQDNNQEYSVEETSPDMGLNRNTEILNDGDNHETTFQLDYTHPFPKSIKLEVGGKTVLRDITSDYTNSVAPNSPFLSNVFNYNQDVFAGYSSLTFVIAKKYSFITGVRYEKTQINGDFDLGGEGLDPFENSYENWLPSVTISRSLKNFRNLKASYTRRIQRPSLFYINPFNNNADLFNIQEGNPGLNPELVDQYELSYNFNVLGFTVFSSGYYKYTSDIIESTLRVEDDGRSINSFENVGTNKSFGINIFTSKTINKFTLRGGGDVYTYDATGVVNGQELNSKDLQYRLFMNGEYTIRGDFKADFFGFFMSPRVTLQGENPSFSIMGVGLRKDFKAWSLGVRIIEPFRANKSFNSNLEGEDFVQSNNFSIPFRSIGINVRYKFGKVDFKERKSKIKNNDLKQGDGGNGSGGGGGGGMGIGG